MASASQCVRGSTRRTNAVRLPHRTGGSGNPTGSPADHRRGPAGRADGYADLSRGATAMSRGRTPHRALLARHPRRRAAEVAEGVVAFVDGVLEAGGGRALLEGEAFGGVAG